MRIAVEDGRIRSVCDAGDQSRTPNSKRLQPFSKLLAPPGFRESSLAAGPPVYPGIDVIDPVRDTAKRMNEAPERSRKKRRNRYVEEPYSFFVYELHTATKHRSETSDSYVSDKADRPSWQGAHSLDAQIGA